jgi:hypothetical protein
MIGKYEIKEGNKQDVLSGLGNHNFDLNTPLIDILDHAALRYNTSKSEMPKKYTCVIHMYWGMGDFTSYYGHGKELDDAILMCLIQYVNNNYFPVYTSIEYDKWVYGSKDE